MNTGTLSQKRMIRNLEERHAAGKLKVNALDSNGLSLVHQFSYDGNMTGLQWAMQHGGSATARSSEGCVAAHYAAAGGHLHILQYLQEQSTPGIDIKDTNGTFALYIAAQEGQLDCLMWLTKYSRLSASEPSHDGMTALHASAQEGHLDCVRYLIQFARCSPTQIDFSGCTPLHFASAEGHWKMVRWLLEHGGVQGGEVDKTGAASIHLAAEYNQLKVLKVFVKLRSNLVKQLDGTGRTPLDICIEREHTECADFLNTWQNAIPGEERRVRHKTSLKKVRFDESNDESQATNQTSLPVQNNNNEAEYTMDNEYMLIQGGAAEEDRLIERMRKNREEWQKSNIVDIELDEKEGPDETANKREDRGLKGSRNVRKRSSFKDKNQKYQARSRTLNRGSIGHLLDKLHLKKGLQDVSAFSLPHRSTERSTRPDLIQSVMEADKNAGRAFTRRPSLEFFQDLNSQLNSGRKEPRSKSQNEPDVPVTIFHNGTLRSSRDNLNDLKKPGEDAENRKPGYFGGIGNIATEAVKDEQRRNIIETVENKSKVVETKTTVVIDGSERFKKRKDTTNGEETSRKFYRGASHEPHPQKKIKLPKGFIGILPNTKNRAPKNSTHDTDNGNKNSTKRWNFGKSRKKDSIDGKLSSVNNNVSPADSKEHYLIRTLPLPSHGSHGVVRHDAAAFFSSNLNRDYKQSSSRWSSVRNTIGSFVSSLRSGKREKIYKVQSMSSMDSANDAIFERKGSDKFNIIKSIQLKTKKRKSISLEHLPYYSAAGEEIQVPNQHKVNTKRLSALQPGYTEPDLSMLTSMALDQTLKGRVESVEPVEEEQIPPPKPEESLDFVVANKHTTGFELDSLQINNTVDGMETGKALMW